MCNCACGLWYEEDVQRLKDSQRGTTLMAQTAGAMQKSKFWAQKFTEYLTTLPAMLSKGPVLEQHTQGLQGLKTDTSDATLMALESTVKDLVMLKASLRPGSTDKLHDTFRVTLQRVWDGFVKDAEASVPSIVLVKRLIAIVSEASSAFALDQELQNMSIVGGEILQKAGQNDLVRTLKTSAEKVLEKVKEENDFTCATCKDLLHDFGEKLQSSSLLPKYCEAESPLAKLLKEVVVAVMERSIGCDIYKNIDFFKAVVFTFQAIGSKVNIVNVQKCVTLFARFIDLQAAFGFYTSDDKGDATKEGNEMANEEQGADSKKDGEKLVALQAMLLQVKTAKDAAEQIPQKFVLKLQDFVTVVQKLVTDDKQ
eukprot:2696863-Amphidinium_carterae.1